MVVEDDPDLMEMISFKLDNEGFKVDRVVSGRQALDRIAVNVPDCVILDVMLPDIDGLTVLNEIANHSETKNLPVIVFSNIADQASIEQVEAIGKYDYLVKAQTDLSQLVDLIKKRLN